MRDGPAAHFEIASELRHVQHAALVVSEHRPQPPQGLGRDAPPELRDVALEVGADEVRPPGQAGLVVGREEAVGESSPHPEIVDAVGADLR